MICACKKIRALALTEVVILVAMLALLIAVLGPALPKAREQSRVATCLANLRFISQSASSYIAEQGTIVFVFPWNVVIDGQHTSYTYATEFIWGGGVSDKRGPQWDPRWGLLNPVQARLDVTTITPADRPLNDYMVPGVWWSHPERLKGNPARYQIPMELPDFFKCPSDSSPVVPDAGMEGDPNVYDPNNPTWAWWGTSYTINWYWAYFYTQGMGEWLIGSAGSTGGVLDGPRHRDILQSKLDHGASEWPLFFENSLNLAIAGANPRGADPGDPYPFASTSWHGNPYTHAAGFADGSARYRRFETEYVDGPGWTLWPNRPWDGTPWEEYQEH